MPGWVLLLLLFLLTVVLVYGIYLYAQSFLLDEPNHRSSHQHSTPRGGGVACVLAYVVASVYLYLNKQLSLIELNLVGAGLMVAAIGFWDDHRHVPAQWRLLGHLFAATIAIWCLQGLPIFRLPFTMVAIDLGWSGYILGLLFLTWGLNLFNFMDGIDGIAASEAIFVALGLAWFMSDMDTRLALFAVCFAVVCLGFLVWNWPPAKIFMGDVGSSFMGFMLGALIILFSHTNSVFGYIGLILFAVFIVDASVTLLTRLLSGQKVYEAHCLHAYQKLAKQSAANGHLRVVLGLNLINIGFLLPLAVIAFEFQNYALICLLLAYAPLIYLAFVVKAGIQ